MDGNRCRGFSLVELVVGLFVACALFLPLSHLLVTGAKTTQYSEDYLRALTIAKGQIEVLRHAAKINKYAIEKLITRHVASGGFKPYTVEDKYRVTTTIDPQFSTSELPFTKGPPPGREATLMCASVRVDWSVSGRPRNLTIQAFIDRVYY